MRTTLLAYTHSFLKYHLVAWLKAPASLWLNLPVYLFIVTTLYFAVSAPLSTSAQWMFASGLIVFSILLYSTTGRLATIALILIGTVLTLRYFYWRVTNTVDLSPDWDLIVVVGLLIAEAQGIAVGLLNSGLMTWPLQRPATPLPDDQTAWPTIDVFIPSYNEPLDVVRPTLIAAQNMLWPAHKLNIYLLDDSRREDFRDLCMELGVGYFSRDHNQHAKAGNINAALNVTSSELIALFDADFRPTRNFLLETVGGFLRDERLFLVQTPHHFFFPDPFDRNLNIHRKVPQEGDIFHGAIQDGKDLWNAAFFCGSSAVLRRQALEEIGGVAIETITEDAHTSQKLHRRGWRSAYLNRRLSAGYSTETLADLLQQRIRWAQGTIQMLRCEGLWQKGMSAAQNLSYIAGYLFYLSALPRLVFFITPITFLVFDLQAIHAPAAMILAYALPYLLMTQIITSRLYGQYRHTFWGDVYETVTSWYILKPTLVTLFGPKRGTFKVTPKGQLLDQGFYDLAIARPFLIFLSIAWIANGIAIWRLVFGSDEWISAILLNMFWNLYNILILSVAVATAWERPQRRASPRITELHLPATLCIHNQLVPVRMEDASLHGMRISIPEKFQFAHVQEGDILTLNIHDAEALAFTGIATPEQIPIEVHVVNCTGNIVTVSFVSLTLPQERWLNWHLFGRVDAWNNPGYHPDSFFKSMLTLLRIVKNFYGDLWHKLQETCRKKLHSS